MRGSERTESWSELLSGIVIALNHGSLPDGYLGRRAKSRTGHHHQQHGFLRRCDRRNGQRRCRAAQYREQLRRPGPPQQTNGNDPILRQQFHEAGPHCLRCSGQIWPRRLPRILAGFPGTAMCGRNRSGDVSKKHEIARRGRISALVRLDNRVAI